MYDSSMRKHLIILLVAQLGLLCSVSAAPYEKEGSCPVVKNNTCPDQDNIQFYLFTRLNPNVSQVLHVKNISFSFFNASNPTKIIIHGFNSDANLFALVNIRKGYLATSDMNVIAVEWGELSQGSFICYPTAIQNGEHVAQCTAQLVQHLQREGAVDVHILGFSLGAHVAGFTANHLRPYVLPRITGLDPAMPLFVTSDKDGKLDATDAMFVDVLHTNAFVQGKMEESGDVDFYFNGGSKQPGCGENSSFGAFDFGCSHVRAAIYFAESLTSRRGFWGWNCAGYFAYLMGLCDPKPGDLQVGQNVNRSSRGFYLVRTAAAAPFAMGP